MSIYNAESSHPGATGGKKLSNVIIVLTIFLSFLPSCDYYARPEGPPVPDSYPYDPSKANAEIISSHDMSEYFGVYDYVEFMHSNSQYYFAYDDRILVLDSLFDKVDEYTLDLNRLIDVSPYTIENMGISDMTVFNDVILVCYWINTSAGTDEDRIIQLKTDNTGHKTPEFDIPDGSSLGGIGYNPITENIWIQYSEPYSQRYFHMYSYDSTKDTYSNLSSIPAVLPGEFIYDNYVWHVSRGDGPALSYIEKRDLSDQQTVVHVIYVNFLGTNAAPVAMAPQDIMWYNDHLWILVPKDGNMTLLEVNPLEVTPLITGIFRN